MSAIVADLRDFAVAVYVICVLVVICTLGLAFFAVLAAVALLMGFGIGTTVWGWFQ